MKKITHIIAAIVLSLGLAGTSMATTYQIVSYESGWDWATNGPGGTQSLGADWHLAVINSQAEQDIVANLLNAYISNQQNQRAYWQFWIGGYQSNVPFTGGEVAPTQAADANWNWINGDSWNYTAWANGEPNDQNSNYVSNASEEGFLTMDSRFGWQWNDEEHYTWIAGYVAEYSAPVPEPSTFILLGAGLLGMGVWRRRARKA